MKRTAFLIALVAVFAFFLLSNFASRAGASRDKGRSNPKVADRESKTKAEEKRPQIATLSRRDKISSKLQPGFEL